MKNVSAVLISFLTGMVVATLALVFLVGRSGSY